MSSPDRLSLPRLIVVTNDDIVARSEFVQQATSVMQSCGARVMLQLRSKNLSARRLYMMAADFAAVARATGARLFVNERIDVALAAGADGVQLGGAAIPIDAASAVRTAASVGQVRSIRAGEIAAGTSAAHRLAGKPDQEGIRLLIGASVHSAGDAARAAADGADLLVLGNIWASASHPGRLGSTTDLVAEAVRRVDVPVFGIGGVTPGRAREVLDAGGYGVAVITGVWDAAEPAEAAASFLEAMQVKS